MPPSAAYAAVRGRGTALAVEGVCLIILGLPQSLHDSSLREGAMGDYTPFPNPQFGKWQTLQLRQRPPWPRPASISRVMGVSVMR